MVLRIIEQEYLLKMLANRGIYPKSKPNNFYKVIVSLLKKDLICKTNNGCRVSFELTTYGLAMASLIAKDFDSPPQFKKYAKSVEYYVL